MRCPGSIPACLHAARGTLLALAWIAIAGCGSGGPAPVDTPGQPEVGLVEVLHPELTGLEQQVRGQISQARERLEAARGRTGVPDEQLAGAYGEVGMLYHAYSLREAAEACYLNASRLAPAEVVRWSYLLAQLQRKAGKPQQAVESFQRVLEAEPNNLPALVHLAELELDENHPERAESLFQRALEVDPRCVPAIIGLGKIASARRDFAGAVERFEAALRIEPEATEIYYPLGMAYRGLGQPDKAMAFIDKRGKAHAAVLDPLMDEVESVTAGWRLRQNRGSALFQEGLYREALEEFRAAVEAAPEEPLVRVNLGSTLTMLGDEAGAAREFSAALEIDPDNVLAHFNLGTLYAKRGDDPQAIQHYTAALRVKPDHSSARLNLANALRRTGRFAESVEHYRHVVEADPRNGAARLGEALALVRLQRYAEAAARLEEGLVALPEDRKIRGALVRVLAASPVEEVRDGPRALALGRGLLAEDSSLPNVEGFAMAAAENGDYALALEWQGRAIEVVKALGRRDLLAGLEENHRRYQKHQPCRSPWRDGDPALNPTAVASVPAAKAS